MHLSDWLQHELAHDRDAGLERSLTEVPEGVVRFSTNDYLGLCTHPALREAARLALEDGPVGGRASRLIGGHTRHHEELEAALAGLKGTPRALAFPTGYAAACGTIAALAGPGSTVILDKLAHACLIDGAKLSGATLRVFEHNAPDALEEILRFTRERDAHAPVLVITESVFSMDGDTAPLRALCDLKERYGAWLMVDEAHATGVFGAEGRGLCNEEGVSGRVDVQMGTLGKALGASGGFIAGSSELIDFLIHRARPFLFTTAMPPALAAAGTAAIGIVRSKDGHALRQRLARHLERFHQLTGLPVHSPIIPVPVGGEAEATRRSRVLLEAGFHVPAVRFPTVARGTARLRVSLTAAHREEDLTALAQALQTISNI